MARVAIYMRVSSVGQEENYSLSGQEEDSRKWAEQNGHEVVLVFNDGAQRSYTLDRPGINDMLQAAKNGEFDILAVGEYDRLSRIQIQRSALQYQLLKYGVQNISVHEPVPEGPIGDFLRNSYAFAAEVELLSIRLRTTGGRKRRVRGGKLAVGAHQLYGYVWANADVKHGKDAYLIDSETAPIVKLIFELVLSGTSLRGVAQKLQNRHIPTPGQVLESRGQLPRKRTTSSIWRLSTLARILSNPAYIGQHSGWRHGTEEIKKRDPQSGEIIIMKRVRLNALDDPDRVLFTKAVCPPIVDEPTFYGVQEILKRHKVEASRNFADPEVALLRNGFAVCGYCGRNMQAKYHKRNGHYRYWCASERDVKAVSCPMGSRSFKVFDLDELVWNWVLAAFENPDVIREAFERWKSDQSEGRAFEYDRLDSIKEALNDAEARWKNCMTSAGEAKDEMTRIQFTNLADDAAGEVKAQTEAYEKLADVLTRAEIQFEQIESVIALGAQARDKLLESDYQDKRTFLYGLGVVLQVKSLADYHIGWRLDHLDTLGIPNRWYSGTGMQSRSVSVKPWSRATK
jgi:site-specific DNA recombinase